MSYREGFGAYAGAWWYHHLKTTYAPIRSEFPIAGSKHTPISSAAFSAHHMDSTRRDLQTALVNVRVTFWLCCRLPRRVALSSISQIDVYNIHC